MKARRRAAARLFFMAFGMCNTISNSLLKFDELYDGWADTFTPAEREYMRKMSTRLHQQGELYRKFAWRLNK